MRSARPFIAAVLGLGLLVGLAAGPAAAEASNPCALPGDATWVGSEPSGLGGTGLTAGGDPATGLIAGGDEDSGMGGTGVLGDDQDGMGGTGVVGTITGFGSICVNGLRITYDPDTPTERNGAATSSETLAVGDVVSVSAERDPATGSLRARSIGVRELVRGPVDAIDADAGTLDVLGQRVTLPAEWDPATLAELVAGDYVAVGGQRRSDGGILASRVALLDAADAASLIGTLEVLEAGGLRVAGVEIDAEVSVPRELAGEYVVATGAWDATARRLRNAELERALVFDATQTAQLIVAGYVEESDDDRLRVGGVRVEAPRNRFDRQRVFQVDDYVLVRGVLTANGSVRAVRIALDARPPRLMIPRPPRIQRLDRPKRAPRLRLQRPPLPPRPPRIDIPQRPVRVQRQVSG